MNEKQKFSLDMYKGSKCTWYNTWYDYLYIYKKNICDPILHQHLQKFA